MVRSLKLSYALWLIGGPFFALYHIYLGRDSQWFLWFTSCGCFLGGWIVDFFRLPSYVAQANLRLVHPSTLLVDRHWIDKRGTRLRGFGVCRWLGSFALTVYIETVCACAVDTWLRPFPLVISVVKATTRAASLILCCAVGEKVTNRRLVFALSLVTETLWHLILRVLLLPGRPLPVLPGEYSVRYLLVGQLPLLITEAYAFRNHRYRQDMGTSVRHICLRLPAVSAGAILWLCVMCTAIYHHLRIPVTLLPGEWKGQCADREYQNCGKLIKDVIKEHRFHEALWQTFEKDLKEWSGSVSTWMNQDRLESFNPLDCEWMKWRDTDEDTCYDLSIQQCQGGIEEAAEQ